MGPAVVRAGRAPRHLLLPAVVLLAAAPLLTAVPASAATETEEFLIAVEGDPSAFRDDIAAAGGTVEEVYGQLDVLAVTLPEEEADRLDRRPGIEVEPNPVVRAFAPPPSFGLDRIDQRNLPLSSSYTYPSSASGAGVDVYVMDTGVRADHAQFGGRVVAGFTAYSDGVGTGDCNGHGTHVAGTVGGSTVGVAPSVRIVPVRVLNCTGSTTSGFEFLDGMNWVIGHHQAGKPAVLNMSLGSTASSIIDDAAQKAVDDGITVVAAAGNSNTDACGTSPARAPSVLTVAASTVSDGRAAYSNFGTCVDLFAPGGDGTAPIYSAGKDSSTAIVGMAGTSMAAPHVSGAAARYLSARASAAPAEVVGAVLGATTGDRVTSAGAGSPNRLLYAAPDWMAAPPPSSFTVGPNVRPAYDRTGGAAGYLGQPTAAEACGLAGGGCWQSFQGGTAYASSAGAFVVAGSLADAYARAGGTAGGLGFPVTDTQLMDGGRAWQRFAGGALHLGPAGAFVTRGWIGDKYLALGGWSSTVGWPVSNERAIPGGAAQDFQNGSILVTSAGAFISSVPITAAYEALGGPGGILGQPTAEAKTSSGGSSQAFTKGSILASGNGAYMVRGWIGDRYWMVGGQGGQLGWPKENEVAVTGGATQLFEGGSVLSSSAGAFAVKGSIGQKYAELGMQKSALGFPTGEEAKTGTGWVQIYQGGSIYSSSAGTWLARGWIGDKYRLLGGASGALGWPKEDERPLAGGAVQAFTGGNIYASRAGAFESRGWIGNKYQAVGAHSSPIGYPVSDERSVPGGVVQTHEYGSILCSSAGVYVARGWIGDRYFSLGGPSGRLGFPLGDERLVGSDAVQDFQGGRITVNANGIFVTYR